MKYLLEITRFYRIRVEAEDSLDAFTEAVKRFAESGPEPYRMEIKHVDEAGQAVTVSVKNEEQEGS